MDKNNQIENIAIDLNNIVCFKDNGLVARYATAEAMYNAGYRKVERGEWIEKTHEWDFGPPWDYTDYTCSLCGSREQNKRRFCPECGADMRGGLDDEQRTNN